MACNEMKRSPYPYPLFPWFIRRAWAGKKRKILKHACNGTVDQPSLVCFKTKQHLTAYLKPSKSVVSLMKSMHCGSPPMMCSFPHELWSGWVLSASPVCGPFALRHFQIPKGIQEKLIQACLF